MAVAPWKASEEVLDLLQKVKQKHHSPRLDGASVAICFMEAKSFIKNKLNLGKLSKFAPTARLYQNIKHDFCLCVPFDLWQDVLNEKQREAFLDLHLTRLTVEYVPEIVEENGKKFKVTDDWGRVQYTEEVKYDEEGNPFWKIEPLDLEVFAKNVSRYGLWQEDLVSLSEAIKASEGSDGTLETD